MKKPEVTELLQQYRIMKKFLRIFCREVDRHSSGVFTSEPA
jgi:hypothetical protein